MSKCFEVKNRRGNVVFTIDDDDAYLIYDYKWNMIHGGTSRPYLQRLIGKGKWELLSRVIAKPQDDENVKFKNNDPTDLRRNNLLCVKKSNSVAKATKIEIIDTISTDK